MSSRRRPLSCSAPSCCCRCCHPGEEGTNKRVAGRRQRRIIGSLVVSMMTLLSCGGTASSRRCHAFLTRRAVRAPRVPRSRSHLSPWSSGGSSRAAAGATSCGCGGSSSSALRLQRKQNRAVFHTSRQSLLAISSSKATTAIQEAPRNQEEEEETEESSVRRAAAAEHLVDAASGGGGGVASKNGVSLTTAALSTRNDDDETIQQLTDHWREHPACNPTVHFKSWVVGGPWIQTILHSELTQPFLGSRLSLAEHLHNGRFRLVRHHKHDGDENTKSPQQKLILLHPDTPALEDLPQTVRDLLLQQSGTSSSNSSNNNENSAFVAAPVTEGPVVPIHFSHHHFTAAFLLEQLLPPTVHPPPTAFETVGHVAHLNLRRPHFPYRHLIGQVLLTTLPAIETVIAKVGDVSGPYRTYEMQVLAGRHETAVQLTESGVQLEFDLAQVYWSSRLSQERRRLLRDEILFERKKETTKQPQHSREVTVLADAFCGVGALCLQAAVQGAVEIWANDWNPHAVQALRDNAARNGVSDQVTRIQCGDAYDFLTDLGLTTTTTTKRGRTDDENYDDVDDDKTHRRLPDHVVMNFPLEAPQFLGALRWWPANSGVEPRVHVYTFARAAEGDEDKTAPCLSAEDVAINLVADNLLPLPDAPTRSRLPELNEEYGCNVRVHNVRDVAPGKIVFCVSFTATNQLLRCMQGDF